MPSSEAELTGCCSGQSWCAVTCTTEILGRKWHTIIVHRLLSEGRLGFNELKDDIDGISGKVLSESLDDLVEKGLVDRHVVQRSPRRVAYDLTEAGRDLRPVIEALAAWGREHLHPDRGSSVAGEQAFGRSLG